MTKEEMNKQVEALIIEAYPTIKKLEDRLSEISDSGMETSYSLLISISNKDGDCKTGGLVGGNSFRLFASAIKIALDEAHENLYRKGGTHDSKR